MNFAPEGVQPWPPRNAFPLSVDALLALEDGQRSPSSSSQVNAIKGPSVGPSLGWPLANQFAYFMTSIFLVAAISFIGLFILPTFDQMWEEFGIAPNFALKFLVDQVAGESHLAAISKKTTSHSLLVREVHRLAARLRDDVHGKSMQRSLLGSWQAQPAIRHLLFPRS